MSTIKLPASLLLGDTHNAMCRASGHAIIDATRRAIPTAPYTAVFVNLSASIFSPIDEATNAAAETLRGAYALR